MNYFIHLTFLMLVLSLFSCSGKKTIQPTNRGNVINWHDGVTIYTAVYFINGDEIGRGAEAYNKVLTYIASVPDESRITFEFPEDLAAILVDVEQTDDPLPFRKGDKERETFIKLMLSKRLSCSNSPFKPSNYLK